MQKSGPLAQNIFITTVNKKHFIHILNDERLKAFVQNYVV